MPPGGVPRASCRSRRRSCFRDPRDEVRRILSNRNKTGRIHRPISDNTYIPRALLLKLVSKNNRGKQGLFLAIRSLRAQEIGSRRSSSRHVAYKAECRDVQRQGDRAGLPVFGTIPATGASRVRVIPSRGRKSRRFRCCRAVIRESSGAIANHPQSASEIFFKLSTSSAFRRHRLGTTRMAFGGDLASVAGFQSLPESSFGQLGARTSAAD